MGKVFHYRQILQEVEMELQEWEETIIQFLTSEEGMKIDFSDALDMMDPVEADYFMKLTEKTELLHRWHKQDLKYGAYRRKEAL